MTVEDNNHLSILMHLFNLTFHPNAIVLLPKAEVTFMLGCH